ncbi:MAG: SMC-Scp complex subunit ScpB [Alphaproteobacteria bacterium]
MNQDEEIHPQLRLIEALLFASPVPVTHQMLLDRIGDDVILGTLLSMLKEHYAGRGVNLVEIDQTYSLRTAPDLAEQLQIVTEPKRKLPRAAAETLAIIAYHQPVTRAEIETVRGVATATGTIDMLLERGWIRPGRRRTTPGRPVTWVTTTEFMSHFNLASLNDLPGLEELRASGLLDAKPVLASMTVDEQDTTLREHSVTTDTEEPAHWVAEDDVTDGDPASNAA